MSIQSEITRIAGNVSDALTAIANKGVTVPSGSNSDDLATLIGQISSGIPGNAVVVTETQDTNGGIVKNITAVDISDTTAFPAVVDSDVQFYDATGQLQQGTGLARLWRDGNISITDASGLVRLPLTQELQAGDYIMIATTTTTYTGSDSMYVSFHSVDGTGGTSMGTSNRVGYATFEKNGKSNYTFTLSGTAKGVVLCAANNQSESSGHTGSYSDILLMPKSWINTSSASVNPTETSLTITPPARYVGFSSVHINAISSSYVGSGVTQRTSSDLSASGLTVTAPAGYYANAATKTITGYVDVSDTTATANMVDSNAYFYTAAGTKTQGTGRMNMWANGDVNITDSRGYKNLTLTQQLPAGRYTIVAKNVTTYTGDRVIITFHSTSSSMNATNRVGLLYLSPNSTSSTTFTLSDTAKGARVEAADSTTNAEGQTATYSDIFLMLEPLSGFQAVTGVTPTESSQTIEPDPGVAGLSSVQIDAIPSTYVGSAVKNVQAYFGIDSVAVTAYTATDLTLTVKKTGTYKVSWIGWRNTTGGTSGSQLYINGTAHGTANTTFNAEGSSYVQSNALTGVSLAKDDVIVVRARARSTSYFMAVGNLIIEEE